MNGNDIEERIIENNPGLGKRMTHIKHNEIYNLSDEISLEIFETPGHSSDHCCFIMKEKNLTSASSLAILS